MNRKFSPTNQDRAAWAEKALKTFIAETRVDYEDCLCDLLADLMHWADSNNFDFDLALHRAQDHYREEKL